MVSWFQIFIQHISFELLPRSTHCARPTEMMRERDFLPGALESSEMDDYKNGVTALCMESLESHLIQSWRGREASRNLIPMVQWPRAPMGPLWDSQG